MPTQQQSTSPANPFSMVRSKFRDAEENIDYVSKFQQHIGQNTKLSPRGKRKIETIQDLMNKMGTIDGNTRRRNFHIDKGIFNERLKQDHMFEVVDELMTLRDQKIQFLTHNFSQIKDKWKDNSEEEMQSKMEYERTRMSKYMHNMIAKDREKKNHEMSKNIKMLKA